MNAHHHHHARNVKVALTVGILTTALAATVETMLPGAHHVALWGSAAINLAWLWEV